MSSGLKAAGEFANTPPADRASIARAYTRNHILGQRIGATILDMGVFLVAFVTAARSLPKNDDLVWWLLGAYFIYFVVMEGIWGATLGKLAIKIRVVGPDNGPPGLGRAFVRAFLRAFEVNPFLFGAIPAGVVACLTDGKQRVGDLLANTYVLDAADAARLRTPSQTA